MTPDQLQDIVDRHQRWVDSEGTRGERASLDGADLDQAILGGTLFAGTNLREIRGLDQCLYRGPSSLDEATLNPDLLEAFLRGCSHPL